MLIKNKLQTIWPLSIFILAFFIIDVLRLYSEQITHFHIDRVFTWLLPTFLFIIFVLKKNPFDYLKLSKGIGKGVLWGCIISIFHIAIYCSLRYLWNHELTINFNLSFQTFWRVILTVGLVEEIVFRGLILQHLNSIFNFRTANIISSILFVLAHIPYWYFGNQFTLPLPNVIYDFFFIFFFGLLEGFFLRKANSLWPCIIHHSVNNALALIIK